MVFSGLFFCLCGGRGSGGPGGSGVGGWGQRRNVLWQLKFHECLHVNNICFDHASHSRLTTVMFRCIRIDWFGTVHEFLPNTESMKYTESMKLKDERLVDRNAVLQPTLNSVHARRI